MDYSRSERLYDFDTFVKDFDTFVKIVNFFLKNCYNFAIILPLKKNINERIIYPFVLRFALRCKRR